MNEKEKAEQNIWAQNDTLVIEQHAFFCEGSDNACAVIIDTVFSNSNNQITIDVYYYLGTAPAFECSRIDTFFYQLSGGTYDIIINSYKNDGTGSYPLKESDTIVGVPVYSFAPFGNSNDYQVFPNPSNGIINIYAPINAADQSVHIYSPEGVLIRSYDLIPSTVNTFELTSAAGTYFLDFNYDEGELKKHRLVLF